MDFLSKIRRETAGFPARISLRNVVSILTALKYAAKAAESKSKSCGATILYILVSTQVIKPNVLFRNF